MALCGSANCLLVTGLVAVLLLPAQYFIPDLYSGLSESEPAPRPLVRSLPASALETWLFLESPPLDLFLTVSLFVLAVMVYLCDWIQRKLMERRLQKLNQFLRESVEHVRAWDARQQQLEATLRMVQNATSEYNLLLYLLLRRHRLAAPRKPTTDKRHHDFDLIADDSQCEAGLL